MSAVLARDKSGTNTNPHAKAEILARLRARLQDQRVTLPRVSLAPAIDAFLPWNGLPCGGWHEIGGPAPSNRVARGKGPGKADDAAATAFTAWLLAGALRLYRGRRSCIIWLPRNRGLYMPGLAAFGLSPEQVLIVRTANDTTRLWATEEALRCPGVAGVLAEIDTIAPVAARRLQLAAERGGALGLALQNGTGKTGNSNVALTRWQVTSAPSQPADGLPGVGVPRWRLDLQHCRGGRPASWLVEGLVEGLVEAPGPLQELTVMEGMPGERASRSRWRLAG